MSFQVTVFLGQNVKTVQAELQKKVSKQLRRTACHGIKVPMRGWTQVVHVYGPFQLCLPGHSSGRSGVLLPFGPKYLHLILEATAHRGRDSTHFGAQVYFSIDERKKPNTINLVPNNHMILCNQVYTCPFFHCSYDKMTRSFQGIKCG